MMDSDPRRPTESIGVGRTLLCIAFTRADLDASRARAPPAGAYPLSGERLSTAGRHRGRIGLGAGQEMKGK